MRTFMPSSWCSFSGVVVGRDECELAAIDVISSGVQNVGSNPLPVATGTGFWGGTKVCTRTLELPVALPTGISVPVTIPK